MERRGLLSVLFLVLVTTAAIYGVVTGGTSQVGKRRWRAVDLIAISTDYDIAEIHHSLAEAGLEPLDVTNATVRIEDFNGQTPVTVSELETRFDVADPRMDPFVRKVKDLFVSPGDGEAYHLLYLPREKSAGLQARMVREALGDIPFFMDGLRPAGGVVGGAVAFGVLLLVVVLSRRRAVLSLGIALLGAAYVTFHGPTVLIRAVITAIGALYLVRHSGDIEREWLTHGSGFVLLQDHRRVMVFALVGVVVSVLTVVVELPGRAAVAALAYVLYLTALAGLYALTLTISRIRYRRRDHRLFSPRPILDKPWRRRRSVPEVFPGLSVSMVLLVVAVSGLYLYENGGLNRFPGQDGSGLFVPVPEHLPFEPGPITAPAAGMELLTMISSADVEGTPLSVAGFVAHRRYQSSLLFDGVFAPPRPGETVRLQRFRRDDGRIESWEEEQLRFDGEWVIREYDVASDTVYSLFVGEGGVFSVVWDRLFVVRFSWEVAVRQLALLFVMLFPVLVPIRLPYRHGIGTVAVASRSERR